MVVIRDKYESYINKQDNIVNKDDVFIGDLLADLLSAQKIVNASSEH